MRDRPRWQAAGQSHNGQEAGRNSQITNDLAAVGNALQSGNLADAKNAYAKLTQDMQGAPRAQETQQTYGAHGRYRHNQVGFSQNRSTTNTTIANDLTSLSNALQSGDIYGARSAFVTLLHALGSSGIVNYIQSAGSNVNMVV